MTPLAVAGAWPLAQGAPSGGGSISAGPLGLFVLLLMAIATVLLIRNMSGRIKRLPREFPTPAERPGRGETDVPPDPSA